MGGIVGGGAIGLGLPPAAAGALAGLASSAMGQWLHGDNLLSADSLGQDAASGLLGGLFGYTGNKIGGNLGTKLGVSLAAGAGKAGTKVYIKCMSGAKNAAKRLGMDTSSDWNQEMDEDDHRNDR